MTAPSSSKQLVPPPPLVATYAVTKLGQSGASKKRLLYVRSDAIAFLDASMFAPSAPSAAMHAMGVIKRLIPIPCIHAMISFEDGKQLQLLVRNEHDVYLWKEDGGPIDDIVNVLLKLTRQSGNPVQYTQESGQVDPDEMRLDKFPNYTPVVRRCELRRAKSKLPLPPGPITLQSWDAIASPLPFALDPKKMTASLQRTFDGLHIVMMGSVLVHTSVSSSSLVGAGGAGATAPVTKVLAFTPTRLIACDEDTGREFVSCCLFAMSRVVLYNTDRVVALHLSDESISTFLFSFPPTAKSNGAHVSDDIGVVSNVIRFLLAREGVDLNVERTDGAAPIAGGSNNSAALGTNAVTQQQQQQPSAPQTTSAAPPLPPPRPVTPPPPLSSQTTATGSAQSPSSSGPSSPGIAKSFSAVATSPNKAVNKDDVAASVPDYRAPVGDVAQRFRSPQVFLARQVLRLTSKGAWEPRVLLVVVGGRVIICDERTNVKRSISLDQVVDVSHITHWEGNALALRVQGEHDLVVRLHPDCPSTLTIEQIILVLQAVFPNLQEPRTDVIETKERLKDIVLRERPMKKGASFVPPARQASIAQQSALMNRASSVSPSQAGGGGRTSSVANDTTRRASVATKNSDASTAAFVSSPSSTTPPVSAQPSSVFDATERRLGFSDDTQTMLEALVEEERNARLLFEALEQDGALTVLHWAGDSERRAMEHKALRDASARSTAEAESERRRQVQAARAVTEEAHRQAIDALREAERRNRRFLEDNAADSVEQCIRDERTSRLWLRTSSVAAQPQAHQPYQPPAEQQHRSSSRSMTAARAGQEATAPPQQQEDSATFERINGGMYQGDGRMAASASLGAASTVGGGYELELSPISVHTDEALQPHSQRHSASPSPASRSIDFIPQSSTRHADPSRGGIEAKPSAVMFKKEVQLFSASSPRSTTPKAGIPSAISSAARFGSLSFQNTSQRSLDASMMHSTPSQLGTRTSGAALLGGHTTPRTLNSSNRLIVFPTPSSSASDAAGLTRGADGSKNCFFRVKIGVSDAIAIVGNEKFAASIHERYHGPDAAANTKPSSAYKDHLAVNANHMVDQRIICVSNDEPRISCGDLSSFLDIVRSGSMRSWVRRDVVMVRSTSFLWVELGSIPFVVAVERGERPAHIADKLLEGGTPGNSNIPSLASM